MRALLVALALVSQASFGQASWPQREVRVLIGFSPGGTTDIVTRLISADLSRLWSQPIVIENRPGAGGNIAGELTARARPDGYSLMMGSVGPLAINASLYRSMTYDNLRDLTPITLLAHVPNMLVLAPRAMPATSFQEFIALLKANPGKYFYASTGNGTSSHLSGELLRHQAGVSITHVPYKGAVAVNDVLAGESVHFMFATIPSVINHVRSGRLRPLAVTSAKRSAGAPELPTVAESGFPGFDASSWFGLVGPAGLPRGLAEKIAGDIARVLAQPGMRDKFMQQGADPVGSTPQEFAEYMRAETAKWAPLVKASGATAD
jgi:tripartite-type tricarboxylate transporter receptor subunit TctC